jgi:hypothetical protein
VLSNILVLDSKVLIYSTSTTGRDSILVTNDFEVLVLAYLHKSNTSIASVDNSSVELEIIIKGKTLAFLGQKLRLFQVCLLFFSEIVISDKEGIISL